jgi:ribosomal protein S18 acetylase RimI-like enzyme
VTRPDRVRDIVVRLYHPADQPQVRALYARTPAAGSPTTTSPPWPPDLEHIPQAYLAFWVAVECDDTGSRVLGMVGVERAGPDLPAPVRHGRSDVARLKRLRVAPDRQRHGVGTRLTAAVIARARAQGFTALVLETTAHQTAALRLYHRLGFTEIGRARGGHFDLVWCELSLS